MQQFDHPLDRVRTAAQISPAAALIVTGTAFNWNGARYELTRRFPSANGWEGDVLVIRRLDDLAGDRGFALRAVQLSELERLIQDDQISLHVGSSPAALSRSPGWRRRTLHAIRNHRIFQLSSPTSGHRRRG